MTDLDLSLGGCERALVEADLLVAMLTDSPESIDPELSTLCSRIAVLRREVERLRRMPNLPVWEERPIRRKPILASESPWAAPADGQASRA